MAPAYKPTRGAERFQFRKQHLLLLVSLLFNFLAIIVVTRSHDLTDLFSQRIFFGDSWYNGLESAPPQSAKADVERCASTHSQLPPASPPAPVNPWSSLTIPELTQIRRWLEAPEQGLNLTQTKSSKTSDNIIFLIEAYYPAKEDALAYLSNPVPTLLPERYARVTIHHGGRKEPVVKDYLVGPLPISRATRMRELTEIYHSQDIPFNARGVAQLEELSIVLAKLMAPLADVLQVSRLHFRSPSAVV
jgi:primary-amine oxidase